MDKLTLKIIRALKNGISEKDRTLRDVLIRTMMDYSGAPRECYTKYRVEGIIFQAFADFMDAVDSPRCQLYQLKDAMSIHSRDVENGEYDVYDAMLTTMMLVSVRNDNGYINGFNEDSFK